ncbi:ATP-binding protein [Streptomyces griseorubiginosus]|uniref:ATP-binding protein n=1 Tax=Streptomyces griseorubiginosus TaxID=67304 RepID=UPI00332AEFF6
MGLLIIADEGAGRVGKAEAFQAFAKDVIAEQFPVEGLEAVPQGDGKTWLYEVRGQSPALVKCHDNSVPLRAEAVHAFFGQLAAARMHQPALAGLLLATGTVGDGSVDSARATAEALRKLPGNENFHVYDAADMLEIAARRGRIMPEQRLSEWVAENSGEVPAHCDLLLTRDTHLWLLELDAPDSGFLVLDAKGKVLDDSALDRLPWQRLRVRNLARELVLNERFCAATALALDEHVPAHPAHSGLLHRLESSGRLWHEQELLVRAGRRMLCRERVESVCHDFERLALTFFDQVGAVDGEGTGQDRLPEPQSLASAVVALRLTALYLSAEWIHPHDQRTVGNVEEFARAVVRKTSIGRGWVRAVPELAERAAATVATLTAGAPRPSTATRFSVTAALCIHLAAAFGPYCGHYRSTLHHQLLPDEPPTISGAPQLDQTWTEREAQILRVVLDAPTPRVHRLVTTNRHLLQTVLERAEDALGRLGSPLPFTRIQLTPRKGSGNYELIDCFFELDDEHVLKIFMGEELYGSKDVWVRELLQNAIDATLLRRVLVGDEDPDYEPQIHIVHNQKRREIHVTDNGVGMSLYHVRKFFSKVGRSYYRSAELKRTLDDRNLRFDAISKFGVGFLSVFMVAESAHIRTSHILAQGDEGALRIYIPALMEDFYIGHDAEIAEHGTQVTLDLKTELAQSLTELVRKYLLCPPVSVTITENDRPPVRIPAADGKLTVVPTVITPGEWMSRFDMIELPISGEGYDGMICVPIPRPGTGATENRRMGKGPWEQLPENRIALAQAGIWVKDDNRLFGSQRGLAEAYHPYFKRVYGLVNFRSGELKLNVSRNEFVLGETATQELRNNLLLRASATLTEHVERRAAALENRKERDDYLRAVLFGAIEDGEAFYWSGRKKPADYDYSNSEALTVAMAGVYARHMTLDQRTEQTERWETLADVVRDGAVLKLYYTFDSDVDKEPLFRAWLRDQPPGTRVVFVRSKREAALMLKGLATLRHIGEIHELHRKDLQASVTYTLVPGPLDSFLRACAGIVRFEGDYRPTRALMEVPVSERTVDKGRGLASFRADCMEAPYILLDCEYWFPEILVAAAGAAADLVELSAVLRELCDLVLRNVYLGKTKQEKDTGLQSANRELSKLYTLVADHPLCSGLDAVSKRRMLVVSDIVGTRGRSS